MSRLADRIRLECRPARPSLVEGATMVREFIEKRIVEESKSPMSSHDLERRVNMLYGKFVASEPISSKIVGPSMLDDTPIFAADDVATYVYNLPKETNFVDVVSSMAPPFDKFFIEFQHVPCPNDEQLNAWGVLITTDTDRDAIKRVGGDDEEPRWLLNLLLFLEREKGKPFGPVSEHWAGLAEDGTWFRHNDGSVFWAGGYAGFDKAPYDLQQEAGDYYAQFCFPALLTVSFLHCRNIEIRPVTPSETQSRSYQKKHGRDLVRYHVLDIKPIRRLLERYHRGERSDLRRALHICRGHFKTFAPDAPLLGRAVGTFWWGPQVRGSREEGIVLKDYRVSAPSEIGRAYREVSENIPDIDKTTVARKDPDSSGRGLAAHNRTQNLIAETVRSMGMLPLSPKQGEPEFDIAWKAAEVLFVCEVKSLLPENEERQLRVAIGQVIRYRQKLSSMGHEPVVAVVATERPPQDSSWNELCDDEGILLIWPEVANERLRNIGQSLNTTR
jgi:hypothetical protein